jgi:hypothetical protein
MHAMDYSQWVMEDVDLVHDCFPKFLAVLLAQDPLKANNAPAIN